MSKLRSLLFYLRQFGVEPVKGWLAIRELPRFFHEYRAFRQQLINEPFPLGRISPYLLDKRDTSGIASGHYFHQDFFVARRIFQNRPRKHVDIGSRIDGFVTHVASFRPIEVFDIRPQRQEIENIRFVQADLMDDDFAVAGYCDSISSLHALEHFGLGRYGDPIDAGGHLKGWSNIHKMLRVGGKFYFSTPIGPQRVEFNAHRVFSLDNILQQIHPHYQIDQFSYVDDAGDFHQNVYLSQSLIDSNCGCDFGCAIFEMTKVI